MAKSRKPKKNISWKIQKTNEAQKTLPSETYWKKKKPETDPTKPKN